MSSRKLAFLLAGAAGAVLLVLTAVSFATGALQEPYVHVRPSAEYTASLLAHAGALRMVLAIDVAFVVLYTAFFTALARYLRELGRPFTGLALGVIVLAALLDFAENHHILALLAAAEQGRPAPDGQIDLQQALSSIKLSAFYVGMFLFGLAHPRESPLTWALSLFLTTGTLVTCIVGFGLPPGMNEEMELGRYGQTFAIFGVGVVWLARATDAAHRPRPVTPGGIE
jgi:hypothetical protein